MSLTFASLVVTAVICYGIYLITMWHLGRRRFYKLAEQFGGPSILPIIGNAHLFIGSTEYILRKICELTSSYPSPFRVWLGPRLLLILTDPEQVKTVCVSSKTLKKTEIMDFGRPLIGDGIIIAAVPRWKKFRKLIQPTFNTKILDFFAEVYVAQSKILVEKMERHADAPEFEIFNLVSLCTLDMICETAMGTKVGAQTNENNDYVEAIMKVFDCFCQRFFTPWLHPDCIFYRTKLGKDQQKNIKVLHDFTNSVIQMRRNEFLKRSGQPGAAKSEDDTSDSEPRRQAFLDLLMTLSHVDGYLSDEDIHNEVQTMVIAANETSAIADSFTMLMLAYHPDIQEKVYRELYEIYGDDDIEERPVTPKDLPRMKYLERVIKESMRLFPPVPLVGREVTDDLDIDGRTFPRGSTVVIGILAIGRNEKYWPDPLKFDPDRFLPEEVEKRHPYAFMAFSGGPRNCIGLNAAMMAMKTLIATVLRTYVLKKDNIVPVEDIRLKFETTMKPVDPFRIRIEKRIRNRRTTTQTTVSAE